MFLAAKQGRAEIVKLLLQHHADKTFINKDGVSICDAAKSNGYKEICDLL
ncbi:ankyrin repeat domain-containing protein [Mucilaginibacter rubeus]|nr:hypothetical protein GCM10011500_47820 [Mucilaginibacter rubeus]